MVVTRHRAWPDKCTDQQPVHRWPAPFIPLSLYFPTLVPPQTTWIPSFPSLKVSPKPPKISLVRCPNVFPLHPIISLIAPHAVMPLSLKGSLESWTPPVDQSWWLSCDSPGRSWVMVFIWVPPPASLPLCSFVGVEMSLLSHNLQFYLSYVLANKLSHHLWVELNACKNEICGRSNRLAIEVWIKVILLQKQNLF